MPRIWYSAVGSVCGSCGHKHRSAAAAQKCADRHHAAIRRVYPSTFPTRAYSDRRVVKYVDGEASSPSESDTEVI